MLAIKTMITENREAEFAIANFFSPKKKGLQLPRLPPHKPLGKK
jgi:hypothetical protein